MEEQLNNATTEPIVTQEATPTGTISPFASREIVPKVKVKDQTVASEDDEVPELTETEPLKQIGNEDTDSDKGDTPGDFLEKSENSEQRATVNDELQSADYYWENSQDIRNKFELEYPGKGREKYNEYYQSIADKYFHKTASYTDDLILNSSNMGEEYYRNGKRVITDSSISGPIGGGYSIGGKVMGQNKSVRQAEIDSKNLLTSDDKLIKVDEDWNDVIGNPKYKNKEGKLITALEYIPIEPGERTEGGLKAVYEGERSLGETVSVHDMNGWITSNVGMETPWLYVIPKAIAKSSVNTVASLASSTVDLLNSTATLLDADNDNAAIRATNDLRNKLKSYEITVSDYDQQNMLTFANGVNLVADVAAQLVLAGGIGKVAGGLAKVSQAAGNAAQKWGTLTALSLMGSADIKDEALKAGFSEDAAAGLFLTYLPAMAAANSLSEIMINGESAPFVRAEMRRLAAESLALTSPEALATDASKWAFAKALAAKVNKSVAKMSETMSQGTASKASMLGTASLTEANQEVIEQIFGDVLKTSANLISKYTSPKDDYPKMIGMYDREYWEKAPAELLMNAVGGAIGGPMAHLVMKHKGIQSLPYQTEDKDKILRLAMEKGPNLALYKESLLRARDKGLLGTDKYSYKLGADKKFTRLVDISEAERANHLSIAEANYRLKMMQVNLYESMVGGFNGTYDEFAKKHPELANQMLDRGAAYDRAGKVYKELEGLYKDIAPENYQAASELKKSWFAKPILPNAAKDAAVATAKENTKTTDENTQVTTNEALSSADTLPITEFSDEIKAYAQKLGVEPAKAQLIIDKEQELDDMVSGKTIERDYLDMVMNSDPVSFGAFSGQRDKLFDAVGDDFLQKLTQADVRRFTTDQQNHANFVGAKAKFDTQVDSMATIDDVQKLVDDVNTTGGNLILSPEKRKLLKSKLHTIIGDSFTETDVTTLKNILENEQGLSQMLRDSAIVEQSTADNSSLESLIGQAQEMLDIDQEVGMGQLLDVVENNLPTLFNYAKASLIQGYLDQGPKGIYKLLTLKTGTDVSKFGEFLTNTLRDNPIEGDVASPMIDAFLAFSEADENAVDLIPPSNELRAKILPYTNLLETTTKRASEESQEDAGEFVNTLLKPVSATNGDVEVNQTDMRMSILKLFNRMQPDLESDDDLELLRKMMGNDAEVDMPVGEGRQSAWKKFYGKALFDATDDAKALMASVKLRQAQIELLMRIGDPRNEIKDPVQRLFASMNKLAVLRDHNAKVLTSEEFNDSLENTKYSKYSKMVSGWLVDPVKVRDLLGKQNLTVQESEQKAEIQHKLAQLMVVKSFLDEAESDLETLISIGESSTDEANVANKFKGSIKEYVVGKGNVKTGKPSGLTERLSTLTHNVDIPEIDRKIMDIVTFAPNVSPENDSQIKELYNKYIDLARALYVLPIDKKNAITNNIQSSTDLKNNADIMSFLNSDVAVFYTHFKDAVSLIKDSGELIMPSMEQELVAIQAFSFVTVPTKDNLIKKKITSLGSFTPGEENMMFVPGLYGTGKTKVIAGYAAKTIQLYFREAYKGVPHNVMMAANNSDQIENLSESAKGFKVHITTGTTGSGFSQEDLLHLFDNIDTAHEKLKDTSLIVFDEATMIENYNKGTNPTPLLQLIYEGLSTVNEKRISEGLPEITFIGLGDRYQGGWRSGATTVRGTVIPDSSEGVPYNISSMTNGIFSTTPLSVNFRSYVTAIDRFASAALDVSKTSIGRELRSTVINDIRTQYGPLIGDETGKLGGVQVVNSATLLYSGIATEIRKQLESNENFRVLIVDDGLKSLDNIEDVELKELIKEYPEAFKLEGLAGISDIRIRSTENAQGAEANYVIINTPDAWLPKISEAGNLGYRYSLVSMLAGRARQFVKIRVDSTVNMNSGSGPVQIPSIQQSTGEFMKSWTDLKLSLLGDMKAVDATAEAQEVGSQATNFSVGDTVQKNMPDGTPIEEVTVHSITPEGDVLVVSPDNNIPEVAGNISDPNITTILERKPINNPAKVEPDVAVLSEAKDERLAAYDTYTKKVGTLAKYKGKDVKVTQYNKVADTITIKHENGVEEVLKVSDVFGNDLTINKIEANFTADKQQAEVVNKPQPKPEKTQEEIEDDLDAIEQEDDSEFTPDDQLYVEYLFESEVFDMDTDTNESKTAMQELEKKGVVVAYSDISKEFDKGTFNSALYFKMQYSNDNFNTSAESRIANEMELLSLMNRASGYVGADKRAREAEMGKFNYSMVTYEYFTRSGIGKAPQQRYFSNAIVATEKSTGKKFILGTFATSKLGDGAFKSFLQQRESALQSIVDSYRQSENGKAYDLSTHLADIPGSTVYEASNIRNKKDDYREIVELDMADRNQVPLVMETDITNDFLSGDKLLVGTTPGILVRSSKDVQTLMSQMPTSSSWNSEVVKTMSTDSKLNRTTGKPLNQKPVIDLGKSQLSDSSVDKVPSESFKKLKGNVVAKYGDWFITVPSIKGRVGLPFITKDGSSFELLYGFTKEGDPITSELTPEDKESLFAVSSEYKKAIEKLGIDTSMKKVSSYDGDLRVLRRDIANVLKYNLAEFDRAVTPVDKFNYASTTVTQLTPTHLADVQVTLNELKKLVSHSSTERGGRSNNRTNLKFSNPMVLRQSDTGKKGLSAGRIFVLYSSNSKYDVTDPAVVKSLENELKAHMKTAKKGGIEGAIGYLRNGVGIITLDYPHSSLTELASIRRNTPASKLNRYAIPSDSVVGKRLMAMFAELSKVINTQKDSVDGEDRLPKHYSRLDALLNAITDEHGNKISVLKSGSIDSFIGHLVDRITKKDPVVKHFLSIIDTITRDSNLGNYVTKRESGSLEDMRKHKFPAEKEDGVSYTYVPGATGKPRIFEINKNPMIFIPQEIADEVGYSGKSQPMRFNLEALLDLIENGDGTLSGKPSKEVVEGTLALLDSLMLNHTTGLNKGIKVPPAMMKSDKTSLWGTLAESEENKLGDLLTTPVKDVRSAALAFNLDNLIKSVDDAKSKKVQAGKKMTETEVKSTIAKELDGVFNDTLDKIATLGTLEEGQAQALTKSATAALVAIKDKWLASKLTSATNINTLYRNAYQKLTAAINSKIVQTEYELSDIRNNQFARPDIKKLAGMGLKYNFDYNVVGKLFDNLAIVVDETTLREIEGEVKQLLASISDKVDKKYVQNYFDAVTNSLYKATARINTKTSIDEIISLFDAGKVKIEPLTVASHEVISSLENFLNPEVFNPYQKTVLLKAFVHGTDEEKKALRPYLDASTTNMNDPIIIAQTIYDSVLGGYPVNEQSKLVMELSKKNPQLLSAVMTNEKVVAALAETSEQDWVSNFMEETELIGNLVDINTKTQYLNALNAVLENLRPVLSENVIKQMEQRLTEARADLDRARSGGNGQDLLSVLESSPFYSELGKEVRQKYSLAITNAQKEVGPSLAVIVDVLSGQRTIQDKTTFDEFSTAKALLMDSLYEHLGREDFKVVGPMLAKLFNSVC